MSTKKEKPEENVPMSEEQKEMNAMFKAPSMDDNVGYVADMLRRAPSKVREDRGAFIIEEIKVVLKRTIEDLEITISRKQNELAKLYDFSTDSAFSLVLKDVDGKTIVDKDLEIALTIRNLRIQCVSAKLRYNHLFGETYMITGLDKNLI